MKIWSKNIAYLFIILPLGCICLQEGEVTITREYTINPNWSGIDNAFTVTKLKLKAGTDSLIVSEVTPEKLVQILESDTTFTFTANIAYNGEKYSERKVYFNKDNGFIWSKISNVRINRKVLGPLQPNTWYLFVGLSKVKTLYYVYIDSLNDLHSFTVPASYWTNY